MFFYLGPILFSLLLTARLCLALPSPNEVSFEGSRDLIPNSITAPRRIRLPDPVYDYNKLTKRDADIRNCTVTCTFDNTTITAGNNVCINVGVDSSGDTTGRGASLTMIQSTVTAGNDININVWDRNQNGLVVLWLEDVTLTAGGRINLNFSQEDACLADDCEVIIYMRNVTFKSAATGEIVRFDDAVYSSRLDKGK
ncbi:uncharacterized protein N7482_009443 [Penicillium canariense]|uniref:Uncharacterized protein n=1 Tax=Penicillium canariense TaxID=189055 RepID=A0A9W9HQV0_9EURO|nr:uncharacterized protein N7482_009443 [Penicillium canariense]KAJ5152965.1 hypothetical protein N7482_009443 [Penicillium canariense]